MNTRLVADIGGTNTRIAVFDAHTSRFRGLSTFINRDYARFEQVLDTWIQSYGEDTPRQCCIAVAAAPSDDLVKMSNIDWSFSCSSLTDQFGFEHFKCINDFTAIAHALPFLDEKQKQTIYGGGGRERDKLAVIGPGTGLGGSTLELIDGVSHASVAEPGHSGLSPNCNLELELFELLLERHPDIYAELLVSGPGLQRLYRALCELSTITPNPLTPEQILKSALSGTDDQCFLALQVFCNLLGSISGDFVLANGAYGGLYLAGGIIPEMIAFLARSDVHPRFCQKGAMSAHLRQVPIHVITAKQPGLIGAAHVDI